MTKLFFLFWRRTWQQNYTNSPYDIRNLAIVITEYVTNGGLSKNLNMTKGNEPLSKNEFTNLNAFMIKWIKLNHKIPILEDGELDKKIPF